MPFPKLQFKPKTLRKAILAVFAILALSFTFFFYHNQPKAAEAGWWNDTWAYRKAIDINRAKVSGTLTNFPMLVTVTDANLYPHAQEDGDDFVFVDASGKKLAHEIELFATSTDTLTAWVNMPEISSTYDQTIYMYYGNPGVASQASAAKVWDGNYRGVWHLKENPASSATVYDSTANNQRGTANGMESTDLEAAKIGYGHHYDGTTGENVSVPDNTIIEPSANMTLSAWVNIDTLSPSNGVSESFVYKGTQYYLQQIMISSVQSFQVSWVDQGPNWYTTSILGATTGSWFHVTEVRNGTSLKLYVNGALTVCGGCANAPDSGDTLYNTSNNLLFGYDYDGLVDEVRLSATARSDNWIATEYNNQNDPASFLAAQAEEVGPGPVAYWSFDEGYGTIAYDGTGHGLNGTISTMVWKPESECVSGKCLSTTGEGEYIDLPASNVLFRDNDNWSFTTWFKFASTTASGEGEHIFVARRASTGSAFKLYLRQATQELTFTYHDGTDFVETSMASIASLAGEWHQVSVTYDGAVFKGYLDAVEEISVNDADFSGFGSGVAGLGRNIDSNNNFFKGYFDEAKIYSYARTAEQVRTDYNASQAGVMTDHGTTASFGGVSDKWLTDGLVGYWKFDEAAGTYDDDNAYEDAVDSSGSNNKGDANGHASTTAGKFGNGGIFDGTGDYLAVADKDILDFGAGDFAVSAWYKTSVNLSSGNEDMIVDKDYATSNGYFSLSHYDDGSGDEILFLVKENGKATIRAEYISSTVYDNTWHHIIGFRNNNKLYLYFDGNLVDTADDVGSNVTNAGSITIGANYAFSAAYAGSIDEVRVYNRALSIAEVQHLYEWAPGPVGEWKMDEKSGPTIYDTSGSGNNGTLYYMATSSYGGWTNGYYGSALRFDGTDDYIDIGDPASGMLDFDLGSYSLSFWIKTTQSFSGNPRFISKGASGYAVGYAVQTVSDVVDTALVDLGGGSQAASVYYYGTSTDINDGRWHNVVSVIDKASNRGMLYIDGNQEPLKKLSGTCGTINNKYIDISACASASASSATNLMLGRNNMYSSEYFNGLLDDVKIYNYARTQKQILENMNAGGPAVNMPIAYWNFDEGYGNYAYNQGTSGTSSRGSLMPGTAGGNTASSSMWDKGGKFGSALEFDGTDDYVNSGSDSSIDNMSAKSGCVWAFVEGGGGSNYGRFFGKGNWDFLINNSTGIYRLYFYHETDGQQLDVLGVNNSVELNSWHQYCFTHNGGKDASSDVKLYSDAKEISYSSLIDGSGSYRDDNAMTFFIGKSGYAGDYYFNGLLDEVKVWNYALTKDEIMNVYNRGQAAVMGAVSTATTTSGAIIPDNSRAKEYCVPGASDYCAPPVGEWKMDEKVYGNGQTIYDTSGAGLNGTTNDGNNNVGPFCNQPGKYGSACFFQDDFVNMGDVLNLTGNKITLEAWIKPETNQDYSSSDLGYIIGRGGYFGGYGMWVKENSTILLELNGQAGLVMLSGADITYNQWNHVVALQDGSYAKIYINGKLSGSPTSYSTNLSYSSSPVIIGGAGAPDYYLFNGLIDDVRIYNYARTPSQIAWDYNRGKPVAYWKFDECQTGTIHDESGNGNNGQLYLGTSGTTATGTCASSSDSFWYNGRDGQVNSTGDFDGTDDYVSIADNSIWNFTAFSVSAWVKAENIDKWQAAVVRDSRVDGDRYWGMIGLTSSNVAYAAVHNTIAADYHVSPTGGKKLSAGVWYFLTSTFDGTTLKTYVNGDFDQSAAFSGTLDTGAEPIIIGNRGDGGEDWDGAIDEVKIYNYALTAEQVKTEYAGGAVRFGE